MVRLHQRPLFLILRLQLCPRLSKRGGTGGHVGCRTGGDASPIGPFCCFPPRRRLGQSLIELDERLTLERPRIGCRLAVLAAARVDDAFGLGVGHQLPLGPLEIPARLVDLTLKERTRI